jgi:hypothetical protein
LTAVGAIRATMAAKPQMPYFEDMKIDETRIAEA